MYFSDRIHTHRFAVILGILLLAGILPMAAALPVSPFIEQGATVYIGEEGLNITSALNAAAGNGPGYTQPTLTAIGWWASGAPIATTSPTRIISLNNRFNAFTVSPADFVGYTGNWYLLGPGGNAVANPDATVFVVADPALDIRIWDVDRNADVTSTTVPRGENLGFRIDTNMYSALDSRYRSPVYSDPFFDGYIDIDVKDPAGVSHSGLFDNSGTPRATYSLNVSSQPYFWGMPSNPFAPAAWSTGVTGSGGQYMYAEGTYTVTASSTLNNMRNNYRIAGADYTGKTISNTYTVTLGPQTAPQPVADGVIAPVIRQCGTVYIGEEGLNITMALNGAAGKEQDFSTPTLTRIGWWPSQDLIGTTAPTKVIELNGRYSSFKVSPADFVGYTGIWTLLGPDGTSPANGVAMVFFVGDPALDLRVWDFGNNTDVTGKSVVQGADLGFRVDTNMYGALYSTHRSPIYNDNARDGYIDIIVKDEGGNRLQNLSDTTGTRYSLSSQNISTQPYFWGNAVNPVAPVPWATGVVDSSGQPVYPAGTYTVSAASRLNNMRSNYRNGGADYTGKTVSQSYTITIVPPTPPVTNPPVPDFTTSVNPATSSVPVQFTDTSTNNPEFFYWSFGDGWYSNERNPAHTYTTSSARNYTVTHIAWNQYGSTNKAKTTTIRVLPSPVPKANFTADVTTGPSPLSVAFADTSDGSPVSWNWSFGDGKFSIEQSPVHIYTSSISRNYSVSLTVSNSYGKTSKITKTNFIRVLKAVKVP